METPRGSGLETACRASQLRQQRIESLGSLLPWSIITITRPGLLANFMGFKTASLLNPLGSQLGIRKAYQKYVAYLSGLDWRP